MIMSEKSKQHVESCRFCWMCHHICPIGNATGQERCTARARALGISLVNRDAVKLTEIMDNIYECCTCGACVHDCTTGWDPVMFTKETRLLAALEGALPEYILELVENSLTYGNPYGEKDIADELKEAFKTHSQKTATLLYLGTDARYKAPKEAIKAIRVLEKAKVDFTILTDEVASGAQLDFLIGAADETKKQMEKCADSFKEYKKIVVYDPNDAKAIKQTYKEYGVNVISNVVTFTSFVAKLIKEKMLEVKKTDKKVVFQDPYQLSRDLLETEDARDIIKATADLHEMLLNREETVWAGNILMAQYMGNVIKKVAERRIYNAQSIGIDTIVTASVSENISLKNADSDVKILSIEDLILGE